MTEGRTYMGSVIALILGIAGAIGLAYLLENLRAPDAEAARRRRRSPSLSVHGHGASASRRPRRTAASR